MPDTLCSRVEIDVPVAYEELTKDDKRCTLLVTELYQPDMSCEAEIRLRGNSTAQFPKRAFNIQVPQNKPLYGMPAAKSWVLLANYFDKTMLRNALAFHLSEQSCMDWTPHYEFVELKYNGTHKGIYQLCEKVEAHEGRVALPADGWLIEIDARVTEKDHFFRTPHMENPYRIDWPHKHVTEAQVAHIQSVFIQAEEALFGTEFEDEHAGWRQYIDEGSVTDWYLINEIAKNCDGNFYSSCYMHSGKDGKITMGPLWDYDTCFGNCIWEDPRNPEGFYVRNTQWFTRLMEDERFAHSVRERFQYYYSHQESYYQFIRQKAEELRPYVAQNDRIWHTIGQSVSPYLTPNATYDEDIQALIDWMKIRFEWLNTNL
jgi:hypothetical protein